MAVVIHPFGFAFAAAVGLQGLAAIGLGWAGLRVRWIDPVAGAALMAAGAIAVACVPSCFVELDGTSAMRDLLLVASPVLQAAILAGCAFAAVRLARR